MVGDCPLNFLHLAFNCCQVTEFIFKVPCIFLRVCVFFIPRTASIVDCNDQLVIFVVDKLSEMIYSVLTHPRFKGWPNHVKQSSTIVCPQPSTTVLPLRAPSKSPTSSFWVCPLGGHPVWYLGLFASPGTYPSSSVMITLGNYLRTLLPPVALEIFSVHEPKKYSPLTCWEIFVYCWCSEFADSSMQRNGRLSLKRWAASRRLTRGHRWPLFWPTSADLAWRATMSWVEEYSRKYLASNSFSGITSLLVFVCLYYLLPFPRLSLLP